jgi:hypothetical protein
MLTKRFVLVQNICNTQNVGSSLQNFWIPQKEVREGGYILAEFKDFLENVRYFQKPVTKRKIFDIFRG